MDITRFIQLNQRRLAAYRKVTRVLAALLAAGALYVLVGGLLTFLTTPEAPAPTGVPMQVFNRFGLSSRPLIFLQQALHFAVMAFLAWSAGEYLRYILRDDDAPPPVLRKAPRRLVLALLAAAALPVLEHLINYVTIPATAWPSRDIIPAMLVTSFLWSTFPILAAAAAKVGFALIVRRLTEIIDEARATV